MTVNEIITRKEPHFDEDQLSIAVMIRDQATTPDIPDNGDPVLVEVIRKCLKANPNDRPVGLKLKNNKEIFIDKVLTVGLIQTMEEICLFLRSKFETEGN